MCWHPGGRGWPRNPSHRDQHQCCPSAPLTLCLSWFLWMLRAEMLTRIPGCNITWHCTHARQHWAASQSWSQVRTGQFIIAVYHEAWMKDFYARTDERPGRPRQQLSSVWTLGRAYHLLDWIKKSRNQPQSRTINMDQSQDCPWKWPGCRQLMLTCDHTQFSFTSARPRRSGLKLAATRFYAQREIVTRDTRGAGVVQSCPS